MNGYYRYPDIEQQADDLVLYWNGSAVGAVKGGIAEVSDGAPAKAKFAFILPGPQT